MKKEVKQCLRFKISRGENMKKVIIGIVMGLLLIGGNAYAANGDLTVNGNFLFGSGAKIAASGGGIIVNSSSGNRLISLMPLNTFLLFPVTSVDILPTANFTHTNYGVYVKDGNTNTGYVNNQFDNDVAHSAYVGIGGTGLAENALADRTYLDNYYGSSGLSLTSETGDIRFYLGGYDAPNEIIRISPPGNVGIGLTSTGYQLQLSTNSAAKPGSSTWTVASDSRLKTNIQPYTKGLTEILQINPVNYQYNGKGGIGHKKVCIGGPSKRGTPNKCIEQDVLDTAMLSTTYVGVIAQDIQPIVPEAVSSHKGKINDTDQADTDILDVNTHPLIFMLINAVKDLKAQIDSLSQQIADLKQQQTKQAKFK